MRILKLREELLTEIRFLNAGKRPSDYRMEDLPVHLGWVDGLPEGVDGLVVAGDLQGRETFESSQGRQPRLLGEVIPSELADLIIDLGHIPRRFCVVLAGDFYTVPGLDRRGGSGDVTEVWHSFADEFGDVIGVAGNHDSFANGDHNGHPHFSRRMHFLDGKTIRVGNFVAGGVSGIIGNPNRSWRRTLDDYCSAFMDVASQAPDLIVLHDGPNDPANHQRGSDEVRQIMEQSPPTLVVRGHSHWKYPLVDYPSGHQVLNVDCRVAILTRESPS